MGTEPEEATRILTADAALHYFFKKIESARKKVQFTFKLNNGRHFFIKCYPTFYHRECYYLVYQRGMYETFSKYFAEFIENNPEFAKEEREKGCSINVEWLNEVIKLENLNNAEGDMADVKLVFIFPDGTMLWTYPRFFRNYAEKNKLIRQQKRMNYADKDDYTGMQEPVNEVTYCIPEGLMKPFEVTK